MSNNNYNADTSMGDAFRQRRSAKQKGIDQPQAQRSVSHPSTAARPPSILEIQAEEERLSLQARGRLEQDRAPNNFNGSSSGVGGGGTGGRDDFPRRVERRGREDAFSSRRSRGEIDYSHLPLEQGCVCSLKDAFGFIYCADREEELFFHFSEVQNCHAADLALDDELEFRVGNDRNSDKLRAFQVNRLERGSIVWEVEDNPGVRYQGVVEKPVKMDRHGAVQQEGIIRMLEKPLEEVQLGEEEISATAGAAILFSHHDYQPNGDVKTQDISNSGHNQRDSRGGNSSSANASRAGFGGGGGGASRLGLNDLVEFDVVTSRRTRNKHARSIVLLQSDRERQAVLKEAALLARASVEQGIVTSLKSDFGFLRSNMRREEVYFHYTNILLSDDDEEEQELKVGNEMQFLVVVEEAAGNGRKEKISARQVKFLPAGTVKFEITLAQGVMGVVTRCPHPADSNHSSEALGHVRLTESISDVDSEGCEVLVSEVGLYSADSPGGTYNLREGTIGLWIREGDTLLFDVVKQTMDGFLRVFPTSKQVGDHPAEENEAPSVKLVSCALALRQEGTVHVIKEEFGFINLAERAAETYFRLYEQFPKEIQRDLLRGMGIVDQPVLEMVVDSEVQFDLSLQREVIKSKGRNQRGGGQQESLKAQRVLVLPPGTITPLNKVLASGIDGIVEKEDPKQPYSGMIELASEVNCMTLEERHPLAAMLARLLLERNEAVPKSLIFPDIQSVKEDDVVTNVVETVGMGRLRCSSLPTAGQGKNGGRMCISWTQNDENLEESEVVLPPETPISVDDARDPDVDARAKHPGSPSKQKKGSKKAQPPKVVKHVRYDKACLAMELKDEQPPRAGDRVRCDVIQSRRTGFLLLRNVWIEERKDPDGPDQTQSESKEAGVGFVSDVVVARKFGFITLFDEESTKKEVLFFHLESILHENSMGLVKKGDEVKFMIATKPGGKRTAVDIEILPRGTLNIPCKAAKNACEGFVLLEPSTSSLKNTPNRKSLSPVRGGSLHKPGGGGTGRWGNVDLDNDREAKGTTKGEGLIVLTKDPSNMFGSNAKQDPRPPSMESTNPDNGDDKSTGAIRSEVSLHSSLCTHLPYKVGAVAIHGLGAASGVDSATEAPRRGDLVSFVRSKDGKGVRDVRVVTKGAATLIRGRLEQIVVDLDLAFLGTALFIASTDAEESFPIKLEEVISCDVSVLNDKEPVEGILYGGSVIGVCRIKDLFLESKLGSRHKMRTKLNLTVKQGLGGKIMAQSMMGKGPDDTIGFVEGWTTRVSKYVHM